MSAADQILTFLGYMFIIPFFQAPMIILILQTVRGKTLNWSSFKMNFWGAWSLIGVIWGNTVGSYYDDYLLQLEYYNYDDYFQTEVSLYSLYPTYRTALYLKTIVNYINTVLGLVLFTEWSKHVEYQQAKHPPIETVDD